MLFLSKRHSNAAKLLYKHIVYKLLFSESPFKFGKVADMIFKN